MDYRRWTERAEWGLVAAVAALHAIIFFGPEDPSQPNFLLVAAHDAQLLSAIVLIIGWVVLGPGRLWIRLAAAPLLMWLWYLPWNAAMQPRAITASFVETFFCAAALLICSLRALGLQVARRPPTGAVERGAQISLRGLLLATTLIAGVVGLLEWLRPVLGAPSRGQFIDLSDLILLTPPSSRVGEQSRELVMALTVASAAIGGLWIVLRPGAPWLRLAAAVLLIPASALYLAHLSSRGPAYVGLSGIREIVPAATGLAVGLGAVAGICGLSVLPLRLMDFRWQRRLQLPTEVTARPVAGLRLAQRVAAMLLLAAAIVIVPASQFLPRRNVAAAPEQLSWSFTVWTLRGVDELEPPLNAFGAWIQPGEIWHYNLSIITGGGQYVHPQPEVENSSSDPSPELGPTTTMPGGSGGFF